MNKHQMINVLADCEQKFRFIHSHDPLASLAFSFIQFVHRAVFLLHRNSDFYVADVSTLAKANLSFADAWEIINVAVILFTLHTILFPSITICYNNVKISNL